MIGALAGVAIGLAGGLVAAAGKGPDPARFRIAVGLVAGLVAGGLAGALVARLTPGR
jgi:hypothetical protein